MGAHSISNTEPICTILYSRIAVSHIFLRSGSNILMAIGKKDWWMYWFEDRKNGLWLFKPRTYEIIYLAFSGLSMCAHPCILCFYNNINTSLYKIILPQDSNPPQLNIEFCRWRRGAMLASYRFELLLLIFKKCWINE